MLVAGFLDDLCDDFCVAGVEMFTLAVGDLVGACDLSSCGSDRGREGAFPVVRLEISTQLLDAERLTHVGFLARIVVLTRKNLRDGRVDAL